jgi:hypothetical protein
MLLTVSTGGDPLAQAQPAAGWYPNPKGPGQRYWDGEKWTHQVTEEQPTVAHSNKQWETAPGSVMTKDPRNNGLAIAGYIFSLIPIVGLILGLILRSRKDIRGNYVLIATGIFFVLYLLASAGSA